MNVALPSRPASADADLLNQVRSYLMHRKQGLPPSKDLEAAWTTFHDVYSRKIRAYAVKCGAAVEEVADCSQEVWRELLIRLPLFQLDAGRGKFDSWLYTIVQSKAADSRRSRQRYLSQGILPILDSVADHRPNPGQASEEREMIDLVWDRLSQKLSRTTILVLQLRLVEERPIAEVAKILGLSQEQVRQRCHRARQKLEKTGAPLVHKRGMPGRDIDLSNEKTKKSKKSVQQKAATSVSPFVGPSSLAWAGGNCVDYVFQRVELGRRELTPEWKVEWDFERLPRPVLFIRKTAMVAYAEFCGSEEFISTHWPRIVNAAIAAGVAAGIATIIAAPTGALAIFQTEFYKQLRSKGNIIGDDKIQVALSAKQEANGLWIACKE